MPSGTVSHQLHPPTIGKGPYQMYLNRLEYVDVVIANGQAVSAAASLEGKAIVGVITPSAWSAAAISFQFSEDGTNFRPVYERAGEVTIPSGSISTSERRWFVLDPTLFLGAKNAKVVSGTNGSTVNQGAARTVTLVVRPM